MKQDVIKDFSSLQVIAKKYLSAIIETNDELLTFLMKFKSNHPNVMKAIGEFRMQKLLYRSYSFEQFVEDYFMSDKEAIQKLFLYPHNELIYKYVINPIEENVITLKKLYQFQQENPLINPILAGKTLVSKK